MLANQLPNLLDDFNVSITPQPSLTKAAESAAPVSTKFNASDVSGV